MSTDALFSADPARPATPIRGVATADLEAVLASLSPEHRAFAGASGFKASAGAILLLPAPDGSIAEVLFGLGKPDAPSATPLIAGRLATGLPKGDYRFAAGFPDPALAAKR